MASARCKVCADLNVDENGYWRPSVQLDVLQQVALQCQSGGCMILLQAISAYYSQRLSTDEVWAGPSLEGKLYYDRSLNEEKLYSTWPDPPIQLFVLEGRV